MLLVSGWFHVSETIIPEAGSTFSSLHHANTLNFSVDWGLHNGFIDTLSGSPNIHYVNQVSDALMKAIGDTVSVALLAALSDAGLRRPESTA